MAHFVCNKQTLVQLLRPRKSRKKAGLTSITKTFIKVVLAVAKHISFAHAIAGFPGFCGL
jgi:hypothetical protein